MFQLNKTIVKDLIEIVNPEEKPQKNVESKSTVEKRLQ
jgi:hypothetical protein